MGQLEDWDKDFMDFRVVYDCSLILVSMVWTLK